MGFQLDNLQLFTGQFHPSWVNRYVLYERWSDLPRVGIAALSAEGYLPFGRNQRGGRGPLANRGVVTAPEPIVLLGTGDAKGTLEVGAA